MRDKKQIINQHQEISDQNLKDEHKERLHRAIELEVAIDTRDILRGICEHLEEIDKAAQIFREINPI